MGSMGHMKTTLDYSGRITRTRKAPRSADRPAVTCRGGRGSSSGTLQGNQPHALQTARPQRGRAGRQGPAGSVLLAGPAGDHLRWAGTRLIAIDTNLLVYAHRRESRDHTEAASIIRELAEGNDPWALPWPACYEFHSVVTNPRIWKGSASTPEQSWRQLEAWMASPSLRLIGETEGLRRDPGEVLATAQGGRRSRPRRQNCRNLRGPRRRGAPHARP